MKSNKILQLSLWLILIVGATSCYTPREYRPYPPPPPPVAHVSVGLVISPWAGIVISRYPDGRYYYRSPQGYIYWRGYDNRYYLDRAYLSRVHYDRREYGRWKEYDRRGHGNGRGRHH